MTVATLLRFLRGDRAAILDVAATRGAWGVGLALVLSAGLAREYDREDLLREPWHAAFPLAASTVTATILFALVRVVSWRRSGSGWPARGAWSAFLGLYWATAPLAWLYAIPVERLLPAGPAVEANLWLLAVVSVWRVALMTRVVQVVWRCTGPGAFAVVGLFAWAVASAVLFITPIPVLSIMGGIELSPAEATLAGTTFVVGALLFLSTPVWIVAGLAVLLAGRRPGAAWTPDPAFASGAGRVGRGTVLVATAAVVAGLAILPFGQPAQRLRRDVERRLVSGDLDGALRVMAAHARTEFPPHWDPPPRPASRERLPAFPDLVEAIARVDPPAWVRGAFLAKAAAADFFAGTGGVLGALDDERLSRYVSLLETMPEGADLAAAHARSVRGAVALGDFGEGEALPGTRRRELLDRILALVPPLTR